MADAVWRAGGRSAAGPPCLDPSRIPRDLSITVMPPTPAHPRRDPATLPPQGRRASDPATATGPLPAHPKSPTIPPTHPHEENRAQPTLPTHRHSRESGNPGGGVAGWRQLLHPPNFPLAGSYAKVSEGGNPGWGAALRSPSPTPRHPATLPPHGRRASDPRRRESRVGRGPAQPITYPPPPRNPPPTWPSRQRPAKAGIQGGARPCAAHHLPPATPQPSPHMAVAPATRESGNPGWRQACAPPTKPSCSDPRKATPTLPGGSPAKEQSTRKAMPKLPGVSTKQTIDPLCTFQVQKAQKKGQTIHRTITIKRPAAGGDPLRRRRTAATPSPHGALQCPKPQPPDTGRSLERYEHPSTAIPPEAPPSQPRNSHLHGRRASDPLQFGGVSCSGSRPCWRRCIRTSRSSS